MPCKESWRSGTASPLTPGFPGNRRAGSSWCRGLGAATLTLDQDSTVTLDGETVILRAGRQRLDSRLSMALFQSGSNHAGELAAAWCGVFCQSAEELGSEELFTV